MLATTAPSGVTTCSVPPVNTPSGTSPTSAVKVTSTAPDRPVSTVFPSGDTETSASPPRIRKRTPAAAGRSVVACSRSPYLSCSVCAVARNSAIGPLVVGGRGGTRRSRTVSRIREGSHACCPGPQGSPCTGRGSVGHSTYSRSSAICLGVPLAEAHAAAAAGSRSSAAISTWYALVTVRSLPQQSTP
ncbi:MAG: hypothetical protein R3F59_03810 [Myxococcota bacterium]